MRLLRRLILVVALVLFPAVTATAQSMPSHDVSMDIDSGALFHEGDFPKVVWTKTVQVEDAVWTQLSFSHLVLGYDEKHNTTSTLKIESLLDGKFQILDGKTARQWSNKSAYFNGNSLRLTLTAYPNGRMNRVSIDLAKAGEVPVAGRSICDDDDDRILSNDPRAGRTSGGCTGWLFDDRPNCLITAGHCAPSASVMFFNVPLSNANGSYNFPGPEDQYAVDQVSKQFTNGGVGDDWCYFGVFNNSNTGLSPFEAQGDSYELIAASEPTSGQEIRITGYGTTSAPVDPTYNGAQKTQVGPYTSLTGNALRYRTDTTGGNSGSPVILEQTGQAIGVHTHGGCGSGGNGANAGTGYNHPDFQNAIANPLGICRLDIEFEFPNGRPDLVSPNGGTEMRVHVVNSGFDGEPGTGMLHVNDGSGFVAYPMVEISPNIYDAVFPAVECATPIRYYVSALDTDGKLTTAPFGAPDAAYSAIAASGLDNAYTDDFETDTGWTVSGDAAAGQWERGVPAGGGNRADPPTDADGSGSCYVTQNGAGNTDVDDGETILLSPVLDASGLETATISYWRWYSNASGGSPNADIFVVDISNDGGSTWVNLETVGPDGPEVNGGWVEKAFVISEFVTPTNQMRLRFNVSDLGGGSVVEAGIDGVRIDDIECPVTTTLFAESLLVTRGEATSGGVSELMDSDSNLLLLRKAPGQITGGVDVEFTTTSPTSQPTELEFTLECSTLSRRIVTQTIEMYNFDTGEFESLDTRNTSRQGDVTVTVSASGDLARFVEPGTNNVIARTRFASTFLRATYVIRIDLVSWSVTD